MSENRSVIEQKPVKKLTKTHIALITAAIILIAIITAFTCLAAQYDKIFSGISVCNADLSAMTANEAAEVLEKNFAEKSPKIQINIKNQNVNFSFKDVGEYDYVTSAENALGYGKDNIFSKFFTYITPFVNRNLPMEFYLDEEKVSSLMDAEYERLEQHFTPTTYKIEDDKLIITSGNAGYGIDSSDIISQIKDGISKCEDLTIDSKITYKEYDGIDIEKIYKEVTGNPVDAYYDKESGVIVPHKNGYKFDLNSAKEQTRSVPENSEVTISLEITYPEITEAKLTGKMFEDVLATYTTKYNSAEVDRTHNMRLAGNKVNGTVLAPGQVFSYNEVVGQRTVAKGYRNAKIFENGRVVDGLAGGICQVSTTIYNAALYSNMGIVERKNHSFPVSYAPKGQDATVVMGAIDFKFKNSTSNPIKITCSISGGNCTVSIMGIKEKNYKVEINNVITGSTPFKTEYENDSTLEPGKEVVKQTGSNGYTIKSSRTVYENGKVIKTESLPSSYYIPLSKIVLRNETATEVPPEENIEVSVPVEDPASTDNPSAETGTDTPPVSESESQEVTSPELNLETEIYS